ncbi:MAG: SufD family Fe-S cluster assembly protein [Anaeroplasmataceae bacterium]
MITLKNKNIQKEITLNNESLLLDNLSDKKIHITVSNNCNAVITQVNCNNLDIVLDVCDNSNLQFVILNTVESNLTRVINLNKSSNLKLININTTSLQEQSDIYLKEVNASYTVKSLSIQRATKSILKTNVYHDNKNTYSNIANYAVAFKGSNIHFDTNGIINKGNSKSTCIQLTKGIIPCDTSVVTTNPNLIINEYDVAAKHGSTIGKFNEDEIFYLMSRGLNKSESYHLILNGMIDPLLEEISIEETKQVLKNTIKKIIGD